jgi:hypothetical protein
MSIDEWRKAWIETLADSGIFLILPKMLLTSVTQIKKSI